MRGSVCALAAAISFACTPRPSSATPSPDATDARDVAVPMESARDASVASISAEAAAKEAALPDVPSPSFDEIVDVLFADKANHAAILAACPVSMPADARIRCLYEQRYKGDAKATSIAHELYVKWRIVAGVEVAHTMDGGYRGMIRLEPAVPIGGDRKHLEWVAGAMSDFDLFFAEFEKYGSSHEPMVSSPGPRGARGARKAYRFRPILLRFMRSVGARTPAAYAHDWTVAYNFMGTLNISADAVRETMFHEIFHLNDAARGQGKANWSPGALGAVFDVVAKKCGTAIPCLAPYSPNDTIVRGGTYYSFQPGNGVMEYAAELALRYYREQRAALRGLPKVKAFKCGPPENAKAWGLMRDEFFDGIDAVPACTK